MFTSASRRQIAVAALFTSALAIAAFDAAAVAPVQPITLADGLYPRAIESFRIGRYPEAYGRFVALADTGHGAAARHALWMCLNGPTLFGRDWDCSPQQVEAWAATPDAQAPRPPTYASVESGSVASVSRWR